tara:strand:+ start:424 stop:1176 length:753 start_codon:yes stop_codon:yes gene_type:complete
MAANMMPLLMMCSFSVSSSSSSGLILAPILLFGKVIMGFFKTLMNPLGAGKKLIKAPLKIAGKGVRAVGRGFKKVGRVFTKRRAGFRRFKRAFRRPRFRRFRRPRFRRPRFRRPRFGRCFAPETPIQLENGKTSMIKNLKLGDTLINGSVVEAVMRIKNYNDPYYKIGDIHVTGSHYVKHGTKYVQVKNLPTAERTEKIDDVVSCLVTNDHKIPVGGEMFWDWEDNLIPIKTNRSKKICESKVECGQYGC